MTRMNGLPRILDLRRPDHAAVYRRNSHAYRRATGELFFRINVRPEVHGAELLPFLAPSGRLTGRWVLSEGPVYTTLPGTFFIVEPDGAARDIQTGLGRFEILGMEAAVFHAGADEDNIDRSFDRCGRFICATAERAICDWIYFAMRNPGYGEHGWGLGPAADQIDLAGLSLTRMRRLVEAMGIAANFERWYARW